MTLWRDHFSASDVPYSLAATLAHEVGHAAQIANRRLDRNTFLRVWRKETKLLNTAEHEKYHGSPEQRITRTETGLDRGVAGCGLT